MSTPQGPDRYGDRDPDRAGPPTWGTPPPGGWGGPDAGPPTGAWDPADEGNRDGYDDEYVGRRRAEDRDAGGWGAAPAPWGDRADGGYDQETRYDQDPAYDDGQGGAWSEAPTAAVWGPDAGRDDRFAPGDEPWAPREAVRTPRRGPGGLGTRALAGIGAGVLVVLVLAVTAFLYPGWAVSRTLDQTALQNGVTQVLTQNYGLQVGAVQCPDDVTVAAETEFSCQALVDGEQVTVAGVVTSDNGDYQVKRV